MRLGERGGQESGLLCVVFVCGAGDVESCRRREMRRAAAATKESIHPSSSTAGAAAAGTHISCVAASSCSARPLANSGWQGERAGGPGQKLER